MRRAAAAVAVIVAIAAFSASPAVAKAKAPTANELVKKLVKAQVCDTPAKLDASGTAMACTARTYKITNQIEIHAYKDKTALNKAVDAQIATLCRANGNLTAYGYQPQVRIGIYWWTMPYRDLESSGIEEAIGGKLTKFACKS
jgi:hypothetical protein